MHLNPSNASLQDVKERQIVLNKKFYWFQLENFNQDLAKFEII